MWVVTQCEKTAGDHLNNDYVELETFFLCKRSELSPWFEPILRLWFRGQKENWYYTNNLEKRANIGNQKFPRLSKKILCATLLMLRANWLQQEQ